MHSIVALALLLSFGTASMAEEAADKAKAPPALKLENLLRAELEVVEGTEVIMSRIEIPAGTELPKHYHPGEEFVYVLEGSGTAWLKGKDDVHFKAGDFMKIPYKQVHTARAGDTGFKALVFRVHQKGQPERVPSE